MSIKLESLSNILHTFSFFISRFREKKLRVCGAEVEWTLQKGGGGFEFTIKIIAYLSLSPSFSSFEIHHFHQASPFCHFRSCGWSIRARLTNLS